LLETAENQIVAVDHHKTLKFYDFVDKEVRQREDE
jgi:hypothetical protein